MQTQKNSQLPSGEDTNNIEGRLWAAQNYTGRYEQWQSDGPDVVFNSAYDDTSEREYSHSLTAFFGSDAAWHNILPERYLGRPQLILPFCLCGWCCPTAC
jgi:hypothetical protein